MRRQKRQVRRPRPKESTQGGTCEKKSRGKEKAGAGGTGRREAWDAAGVRGHEPGAVSSRLFPRSLRRHWSFKQESDRTRFAGHTCCPANELNLEVASPGKWQ